MESRCEAQRHCSTDGKQKPIISSIKINKNKICLRVLPYNRSDVIRRGQFSLDGLPQEKVKEFMKLLFTADIKDADIWFDKLDSDVSPRRQRDEDMDLEKFLSEYLSTKSFIRLQTGDPSVPGLKEEIRFCVKTNSSNPAEYFAWFVCDLNIENYKKVDKLFKKVFGTQLKEVCKFPSYLM